MHHCIRFHYLDAQLHNFATHRRFDYQKVCLTERNGNSLAETAVFGKPRKVAKLQSPCVCRQQRADSEKLQPQKHLQ